MLKLNTIPPVDSAERSRLLSTREMRCHALERLYQRKFALDNLILSLEDYCRAPECREPEPSLLSVAR